MVRHSHQRSIPLSILLHGEEIHVFGRAGVFRRALENDDLIVAPGNDLDRLIHFALGGHARRQHHGAAKLRHGLQQRPIGQVARGHFVGGQVQRNHLLDADQVANGAQVQNPLVLGVRLQIAVLLPRQLKEFSMLAVCGAERVLVLVGPVAKLHGQLALHVPLLELDGAGVAESRHVDKLLGDRHVAVVILADLRGDAAGLAVSHEQRAEGQLLHGAFPADRVRARGASVHRVHRFPPRRTTRRLGRGRYKSKPFAPVPPACPR